MIYHHSAPGQDEPGGRGQRSGWEEEAVAEAGRKENGDGQRSRLAGPLQWTGDREEGPSLGQVNCRAVKMMKMNK